MMHYCKKVWRISHCECSATDGTYMSLHGLRCREHCRRRMKNLRELRMVRSAVKFCCVYMAWLLHTWFYSSSQGQQNIKPIKNFPVDWERASEHSSIPGEILTFGDYWRREDHLLFYGHWYFCHFLVDDPWPWLYKHH